MTGKQGAVLTAEDIVAVQEMVLPSGRSVWVAHAPGCTAIRTAKGWAEGTTLGSRTMPTWGEALRVAWPDGCIDVASLPVPADAPSPAPATRPGDAVAAVADVVALYHEARGRRLDPTTLALAARLAADPPAYPGSGCAHADNLMAVADAGWSVDQVSTIVRLLRAHPAVPYRRPLTDATSGISAS